MRSSALFLVRCVTITTTNTTTKHTCLHTCVLACIYAQLRCCMLLSLSVRLLSLHYTRIRTPSHTSLTHCPHMHPPTHSPVLRKFANVTHGVMHVIGLHHLFCQDLFLACGGVSEFRAVGDREQIVREPAGRERRFLVTAACECV